jgi:hypothetical protein
MAFFLEKKRTKSSPYVLIDESKHIMRFEGESFSEHTIEFYQDIKNWLGGYLESDFETFTFDCCMVYFNSSTLKILSDMITLMDESSVGGKTVVINWYANGGDDMAKELCEDFQEDLENITINLVLE